MPVNSFDDVTLRNIADIISNILTHRKISEYFNSSGFTEAQEGTNKTDRIYFTLRKKQNDDKCANNVVGFVQKIIHPKRYNDEAIFERDRTMLNEKLIYEGLEIDKSGQIKLVDRAKTISEAKTRSLKIKQRVHGIGIHPDILPYCEEEWLKENYFHAILEITKSVAQRLRNLSGLNSDGSDLVDLCLGLGKEKKPLLAINLLSSESDESEQKGFGNFVKGFFSMYRNPKAHDPKILEDTQVSEMTEVLVVATIIHNRLDHTFKTGFR